MSLPNIGVGSPITINNINEIINAINRLSLDVQSLQARFDKVSSTSASSGENTSLYVVESAYSTTSFTITASQASLPANAVFTSADIIAIIHNSRNLLNQGFNAKITSISGENTRKLTIGVRVTKTSSATIQVAPTAKVKWKFDLDYKIPSGGSAPIE